MSLVFSQLHLTCPSSPNKSQHSITNELLLFSLQFNFLAEFTPLKCFRRWKRVNWDIPIVIFLQGIFLSTFLMLGVVETIDMSFDSVKFVAVAFQSIFFKILSAVQKNMNQHPIKTGWLLKLVDGGMVSSRPPSVASCQTCFHLSSSFFLGPAQCLSLNRHISDLIWRNYMAWPYVIMELPIRDCPSSFVPSLILLDGGQQLLAHHHHAGEKREK